MLKPIPAGDEKKREEEEDNIKWDSLGFFDSIDVPMNEGTGYLEIKKLTFIGRCL